MALGREPDVLVAADAVQHLELVLIQFAPGLAAQLLGDGDETGIVGPDHRVALALHQDPGDADVRLVDLGLVLVRDGGGLLVGALHDAYAAARGGEPAGVVLGAEQIGLDDAAGLREVLPQLLVDGEHRVEGGVVLGVQGDRGADGGSGLDDRAHVGEGQLVAVLQRLAEHGQLHGHLGAGAQAEVLQALHELQIRVAGGLGLRGGGDVLADDVERDLQTLVRGVLDDRHDLVDGLPGDEAVDDLLGAGRGRDEPAHLVAARCGENHGTQHGAPPRMYGRRAATVRT